MKGEPESRLVGSRDGEWRMVNWYDHTGADYEDGPATLGKILALYH